MPVTPPKIYTLPLFPLGSVLFPQFPLQLHIFEDRYKAMIGECIDKDMPFGVVLIREGREVGAPAMPHDVGCVARILDVERFADGRMNLLAVCEQRFRVLDYMEGDLPYLIGKVEELDDQPMMEDVSDLTADLSGLFARYLALLAERANIAMPEVELPEDPQSLAFCVASVAMLPPEEKQTLLEMTDTQARLEDEVRLLREQIAVLESSDSVTINEDEDDNENEAGGEETEGGMRVLIARPLDLQTRKWQKYVNDLRN